MKSQVFITGATGKVGRNLVRELEQAGLRIRAGIHTPCESCGFSEDVEEVPFDFEDAQSIRAALQDAETLSLLTPPDARQVDWAIRTIDLAK
jgi:uncharacterized protein YbjT (DUF2867 family)